MFCLHCGQQLLDDAAFCSACGQKVPSVLDAPVSVSDFQTQKNSIREGEITALKEAIYYFSQKASVFQSYDTICRQIIKYVRGPSIGFVIGGFLAITFAFIFLHTETFATPFFFFSGFMSGIALIITWALLIVHGRNMINRLQQPFQTVSEALFQYYLEYPHCPVGPEYIHPKTLAAFLKCLQSGRADTIKESINLTINEANKKRMSAYRNMISQNTAEVRANSAATAVLIWADFFL